MRKYLISLMALIFMMAGCKLSDRGPQMISIQGVVFGTYYSIIYFDDEGRVLQEPIDSLFSDFNSSLSFYDPQSLLSRINRNEETRADDYFRTVFNRAMEISRETDGAFDATVFPLVNSWGFGYTARLDMNQRKVDSLRAFVGHEKVRLENGVVVKEDDRVQLDFNAIAKGYAADVVGFYLESKGIDTYMVEIGGDLIARGIRPDGRSWRIGLEIPAEEADAPQQWEYLVEVDDAGLATSGDYRKYYEVDGKRLSHTIDPHTGYPVSHSLLSVSVFAANGMDADAYATAFMVMGLERSIAFVEENDALEAYFIYADTNGRFGYHATSGLELISREDL